MLSALQYALYEGLRKAVNLPDPYLKEVCADNEKVDEDGKIAVRIYHSQSFDCFPLAIRTLLDSDLATRHHTKRRKRSQTPRVSTNLLR